jgi:hypothetical protein
LYIPKFHYTHAFVVDLGKEASGERRAATNNPTVDEKKAKVEDVEWTRITILIGLEARLTS